MKKLSCLIGCVALAGVMLTACGNQTVKFDDTSMDITKIDVDSYISELGAYSGLTVETEKKMIVNDNTVDQYIDYVLTNMGVSGEMKEVDREIVEGDVAVIDYVGTKDGVAFDGGTGSADLKIGSGQFIPGFESGLIGHKKGEVVVLPLTFPENYGNSELAGQDVEFEVTINAVNEEGEVKITDDFVQNLGIDNVSNETEFRAYILENLEENAENIYLNGKRDALLNKIYDATSFAKEEVPQNLFDYYLQQTIANDQSAASSYNTTLQEYVPVMYGKSYEEYMDDARESAKIKVRDIIICQKIANLEGITITEKEIDEDLEENAKQYGYESVDDFLKTISREDFANYMLELKVIDKLLESTTIIEKDSTDSITE